ncbi:monocarboxylate transporter 12-B-like [Liolophura sinensis]|uniref:monocarboxylate transporter 12-B-like n=1 Tax=Liolophura sinensis TaxID=3198878 RepID=UPI0031589F31
MLASFIISILVDGVCLNIGVFFPYFLDYFQESKGKTSVAGSVLNGTYLLVGPITSALTNRYGCRNVTIAGAMVSSAAFFLATFSPNVDVLIFLYGAVAGFGFGLMYLPAIVMVGYYFEAKRAFATGVAVCGSGIGLFMFAPLTELLVKEFSWKGALWIISALVLHGVVCGAAYRPLRPTIRLSTAVMDNLDGHSDQPPTLILPKIVITPAKSDELLIEGSSIWTQSEARVLQGRTLSEECLMKAVHFQPSGQQNSSVAPSGTTWVGRLAKSQDISLLSRQHNIKHSHNREAERLFRPLDKKDIFYSGSIPNLRKLQPGSSVEERKVTVGGSGLTICSEEENDGSTRWKCSAGATKVLKDMLDFSLISSPTLLIYLISCLLVMIGFFVPFAYIPALAIELGIDSTRAALLVSILGITNTIGRIISGLLSDRSWVDCVLVNNTTLIFGGLITIAVPFLSTFLHLAIYAALYGLSISPFVSLRSVILVELLGLDKLTTAFGLVIFSQGVSSYLGSPIAGTLSDSTGSYNIAFYMAGSALIASGMMGLPLRRLSKWENRKNAGKDPDLKTVEEASKLM